MNNSLPQSGIQICPQQPMILKYNQPYIYNNQKKGQYNLPVTHQYNNIQDNKTNKTTTNTFINKIVYSNNQISNHKNHNQNQQNKYQLSDKYRTYLKTNRNQQNSQNDFIFQHQPQIKRNIKDKNQLQKIQPKIIKTHPKLKSYQQIQHQRQLKSIYQRINNCNSLNQRKKDHTDPFIYPIYFIRKQKNTPKTNSYKIRKNKSFYKSNLNYQNNQFYSDKNRPDFKQQVKSFTNNKDKSKSYYNQHQDYISNNVSYFNKKISNQTNLQYQKQRQKQKQNLKFNHQASPNLPQYYKTVTNIYNPQNEINTKKLYKEKQLVDIYKNAQDQLPQPSFLNHSNKLQINKKAKNQQLSLQHKQQINNLYYSNQQTNNIFINKPTGSIISQPLNLPKLDQTQIIKHLIDHNIYKQEDLKIIYSRFCHSYGTKAVDKIWNKVLLWRQGKFNNQVNKNKKKKNIK